jgi:membrane-bound lytic murein transglycosylase A
MNIATAIAKNISNATQPIVNPLACHVYTLAMKKSIAILPCAMSHAKRTTLLASALALLLAFASSHVLAQPAPPALTTPPLACPPPIATPAPVCPACPACPVPAPFTLAPLDIEPQAAIVEALRGRLIKAEWTDLVDWSRDNPADALTAFEQGCNVLKSRAEWASACAAATALVSQKLTSMEARAFFRQYFQPFQVVNADESATGTVTGYYEPLLRGSRTPTEVFRYPIYAAPQDLVTVDLSETYADLKHRRLRGRMVGNKLVPYYDRAEIEASPSPLKGLEIAWVDNAVELFFLQIQGSGQIVLPDGNRIRLGYADQNGHPFRSLGGLLIRRGEIRAERASMQGIKAWAERNPAKVQAFMNGNPSYVFFKEISSAGTGPIGTLGVPLTAERSIAVDPRVIPLGVPVFLATTFPNSKEPLNRLMVAQDTGGAIAGGVRVDFYWGFGDEAGAQAGRMKQKGRKWVLLPNGYDPNVR